MIATFNGNLSTIIISCYIPTNAIDGTDLIRFYDKLFSFVCSNFKHNFLILIGDLNGQISKTKTTDSAYTTHQTEMGEYLTEFSLENRLTCLNT